MCVCVCVRLPNHTLNNGLDNGKTVKENHKHTNIPKRDTVKMGTLGKLPISGAYQIDIWPAASKVTAKAIDTVTHKHKASALT